MRKCEGCEGPDMSGSPSRLTGDGRWETVGPTDGAASCRPFASDTRQPCQPFRFLMGEWTQKWGKTRPALSKMRGKKILAGAGRRAKAEVRGQESWGGRSVAAGLCRSRGWGQRHDVVTQRRQGAKVLEWDGRLRGDEEKDRRDNGCSLFTAERETGRRGHRGGSPRRAGRARRWGNTQEWGMTPNSRPAMLAA